MNRHELLDLVMGFSRDGSADVIFESKGDIIVTTWDKSGKIRDVWSSYNYNSLEDFFETVKTNLK